jgi:hypothetical protein
VAARRELTPGKRGGLLRERLPFLALPLLDGRTRRAPLLSAANSTLPDRAQSRPLPALLERCEARRGGHGARCARLLVRRASAASRESRVVAPASCRSRIENRRPVRHLPAQSFSPELRRNRVSQNQFPKKGEIDHEEMDTRPRGLGGCFGDEHHSGGGQGEEVLLLGYGLLRI